MALRALDGRQAHASYREIASAPFGAHDVAQTRLEESRPDRTTGLLRFGLGIMQAGYRHLLFHPYRR